MVSWFAEFVAALLKGLEIHRDSYEDAKTREEVVLSLRTCEPIYQDVTTEADVELILNVSSDSLTTMSEKQKKTPPDHLKQFCKIIPYWPSVMFGSSRFLHSTRLYVFYQSEVLKELDLPGVVNIWKKPVSDDLKADIMYGQVLKVEKPMDGTDAQFLTADPELKYPVVEINPEAILNSELSKLAKEQNRSARYILKEWTRLNNPSAIQTLLFRASESGGSKREERFWFPKLSRYEEMR